MPPHHRHRWLICGDLEPLLVLLKLFAKARPNQTTQIGSVSSRSLHFLTFLQLKIAVILCKGQRLWQCGMLKLCFRRPLGIAGRNEIGLSCLAFCDFDDLAGKKDVQQKCQMKLD